MCALLSVRDLSVSYRSPSDGAAVPAVRGVSLEVHPGSMTCVVGESGSGKSTTALASVGLLPPPARVDAGSIWLGGREVTGYTEKQWRALRGTTVGLVPQDPHNSLNPLKTIGASVAEPLAMRGRDTSGVIDLLAAAGIDDPARRARQYPHELSGGLKQRALIAAALALEPELLIADEPTSALDVTVQKIILDLLDSVRRERGIGILFITHDLAVAGDRADRVVVMQRGRVQEEGLAATVLTEPRSE
ncbi:Oligopeptide transport ATP-binding protein OppD [Corynebacterium oculi]|uniref:Oligopeptide transport ATP-binding protein OppD n=1 Tax=Corynebacterium oculi TaxID=1544416 RepID=A0A0Q1AEB9_9CORY|nr:Oligopeptide transport ATP-binding protein OppD [Corynebacterium oculi]